jgi:hypothetical protein
MEDLDKFMMSIAVFTAGASIWNAIQALSNIRRVKTAHK